MRGFLVLALISIALVPSATAEAYLHGRLLPATQSVTLPPGGRTSLDYDWSLEFENTTCSSPVEVGVNLIVATSPRWAGASFDPYATKGESPRSTGRTRFEVALDDEGPRPAEDVVRLAIELNPYSVANCAPTPMRLEEGATLTIRVSGDAQGTRATQEGHGTPGPGWFGTGVALVFLVRRVDAFHRNQSPGRF